MLGNGFSISLKPDIFSYQSLYQKADFGKVPHAQKIFDALETSDFEEVIRAIVGAAKFLKVYETAPPKLIEQLQLDAAEIKNILVTAIGKHHPDRPYDVTAAQYAACRAFLSNFAHIIHTQLRYFALLGANAG